MDPAQEVFELYRVNGNENYIGENVTQVEHAIQCAMQAENEGHAKEIILGAFLHDIGHLLPVANGDHMYTDGIQLGVKGHEKLGKQYLESLGVPQAISDIALGHVDAKRYLCFKDPEYYNRLSEASKMTLTHQGGPMTKTEASKFENMDNFNIMLEARKWDEAAKIENLQLCSIEKYEQMLNEVMGDLNESKA